MSGHDAAINTDNALGKNEIIDTQIVKCQTQFNSHCVADRENHVN